MTQYQFGSDWHCGFSHDFGSLDGKHASVTELFDTFGNNPCAAAENQFFILLAQAFPILAKIPTKWVKLTKSMGEVSNDLLIRSRREKDVDVGEAEKEKSTIGLLGASFSKTPIIVP